MTNLKKQTSLIGIISFLFYTTCLGFLINRGLNPLNESRLEFITVIYFGLLAALLTLLFLKPQLRFLDKVYQYRYWLATYLLILFVILEVHGSSIGNWNAWLQSDVNNTLLGTPRAIRTDEWAMNTLFALSQYADSNNLFPYLSNIIRGTTTDVFIVYGQPVLDVAVLFRPFHWGYLAFSPAAGLSFFWMARLIALFMVSFEMGMLITDRKKQLSVLFAFMVTLAPMVQWWFAITGIEMLVFGQLIVILIDKYLKTESRKHRYVYTMFLGWLGVSYLLTFYPPWQIPLAYVLATLVIWSVANNYYKGIFTKNDWINLILFIGIVVIALGYIFIKSKDTIFSLINTAYPGARLASGGGVACKIFSSIGNLFLPYGGSMPPDQNHCELALFFDLFPIGIILAFIVLFIQNKRDKGLIALLIVNAFLLIWCTTPWLDGLREILLLSKSMPKRTLLAVGFVNLLLLIRAISLFENKINMPLTIIISVVTTILITAAFRDYYAGYMTPFQLIISFIVMSTLFVLVLNLNKNKNIQKTFVIFMLLLMLVMGGTVNPVEQGVGAIMGQPIVQSISEVQKQEDGLWIVETLGPPFTNIPIVAGAPTINSTNVYPYLPRWRMLDPNREYENIYNRYAHITIVLQEDEKTHFKLDYGDAFTIYLNVEDLYDLKVTHVISVKNLCAFNNETIEFEKINTVQGISIYRLLYK